jgi:hypothetical protein
VECVCGAWVTDERRTCPGCGRTIHPDAPVEVVGRPRHESTRIKTARKTSIRVESRSGTLPLFATGHVGGSTSRTTRRTTPSLQQLPVWHGNELTRAMIELRGSAKRILNPDGAPDWRFDSFYLALVASTRKEQSVQISRSGSFLLDDPDTPSADALAFLTEMRDQAERMGFEQRASAKPSPWHVLEFRPKVEW